jgi:hypothetical protein
VSLTAPLKVARSAWDALYLELRSGGVALNTILFPAGSGWPLEHETLLIPGEVFVDQGTGTQVRVLSTTSTAITVALDVVGAADTVPPTCAILTTWPSTLNCAGLCAPVSGTITVDAEASDDVGVWSVTFTLGWGGTLYQFIDLASPYRAIVDTMTIRDGPAGLGVRALDRVGNSIGCSPAWTLFIENGAVTPNPTPTSTPTTVVTVTQAPPTATPTSVRTPTPTPTTRIPPGHLRKTPRAGVVK